MPNACGLCRLALTAAIAPRPLPLLCCGRHNAPGAATDRRRRRRRRRRLCRRDRRDPPQQQQQAEPFRDMLLRSLCKETLAQLWDPQTLKYAPVKQTRCVRHLSHGSVTSNPPGVEVPPVKQTRCVTSLIEASLGPPDAEVRAIKQTRCVTSLVGASLWTPRHCSTRPSRRRGASLTT